MKVSDEGPLVTQRSNAPVRSNKVNLVAIRENFWNYVPKPSSLIRRDARSVLSFASYGS